jgi:hypothetical protein
MENALAMRQPAFVQSLSVIPIQERSLAAATFIRYNGRFAAAKRSLFHRDDGRGRRFVAAKRSFDTPRGRLRVRSGGDAPFS